VTIRSDKDRPLIEAQAAREQHAAEEGSAAGEDLYRERMLNLGMLDLVRAQEQLRQACDLTRSAAQLLAELGTRRVRAADGVRLHAEIELSTNASKICQEALDLLDRQIAKAPPL
jgi:hypothetical protein